MNLKTILPIVFLFFSVNFYAQSEKMKEKREQIRTLKVACFTTELQLTTNEAEKFWPLYNAYDEKQFELRHKRMRTSIKKMDTNTLDKMTEKEASLYLIQMESTEEELFLLRKKFISNLKGILPSVKIIKLKKSEDDFNRKLLKQYRDHGNNK
jgi:hypothetical protein